MREREGEEEKYALWKIFISCTCTWKWTWTLNMKNCTNGRKCCKTTLHIYVCVCVCVYMCTCVCMHYGNFFVLYFFFREWQNFCLHDECKLLKKFSRKTQVWLARRALKRAAGKRAVKWKEKRLAEKKTPRTSA